MGGVGREVLRPGGGCGRLREGGGEAARPAGALVGTGLAGVWAQFTGPGWLVRFPGRSIFNSLPFVRAPCLSPDGMLCFCLHARIVYPLCHASYGQGCMGLRVRAGLSLSGPARRLSRCVGCVCGLILDPCPPAVKCFLFTGLEGRGGQGGHLWQKEHNLRGENHPNLGENHHPERRAHQRS